MLQQEKIVNSRLEKLDIYSQVEITVSDDRHDCVYPGQRGKIIARHDDPQKVQYFVAITCGHYCVWFFTRDQIRPVNDKILHSQMN